MNKLKNSTVTFKGIDKWNHGKGKQENIDAILMELKIEVIHGPENQITEKLCHGATNFSH